MNALQEIIANIQKVIVGIKKKGEFMRQDIKRFIFIMKYIWKIERIYVLVRIPQIILEAIKPFIMIIFPKLIIDLLTMNPLNNQTWIRVCKISILMIILNMTINLLLRILYTCVTNTWNSFSCKHNTYLGKKVMSIDYDKIENTEILDLFERTKDPKYCESIFYSLAQSITNILTAIGLIYVLSSLNILIIGIILAVVFINVICNRKIQNYDYAWHKEAAPYQRKSSYLMNLMQNFKYGKEIRVFGESDYLVDKYSKFNKEYLHKLFTITIKFLRLNTLTTIFNVAQEGGMYLYLAYKVYVKQITIGGFSMLIASISQLTNCLINISGSVVSLKNYSKYIEELMTLINLAEESRHEGLTYKEDQEFTIEFSNVSFKYPGVDLFVLKNINVKFCSNQKISIVGTNGSGKTTFIKLLLRLYKPTEGHILLNGIDINTIKYEEYIRLFSAVFQDYHIKAFSVLENVSTNENGDKDKVIKILDVVNMKNKVFSLPNKMNTILSKEFERDGLELSGGEQQKIMIAKALYKNSQVLILDEPTSALDPLMEYEIYNTINHNVQNRGIVFISHRLSITKYCDVVFVFHNGEIVQTGSHNELMRNQDALYYEMYNKQAEFYKDVSEIA
ncbi:MAG: ABC transporter ATP-binding protein [Lachnospiraceae bacterium]|nr:ABC transporter ATP-binding protein [Lachnospiraceae bacterium]